MDGLEFINAKDGGFVPVLDGKALHSTVNPKLEAEKLVRDEIEHLSGVRTVVVLGLGGGYHVEELRKAVPATVLVIEAEKDIALAVQDKNPGLLEEVQVIAGLSPSLLATEKDVLKAMSGGFGFFKHPASLRMRPAYYKSVLQMLTSRAFGSLKTLSSENPDLAKFFSSLEISEDENATLPRIEEAIQRRTQPLDEASMIWMALRELVK